MAEPYGFTWIEAPFLAASAMPSSEEELAWLRDQGIDIILTLTEYGLPRRWVDQQGLMNVHVPIPDMSVPSMEEIEKCIGTIERAKESKMGVLVHCMAGKGRTGTILALYLTKKGLTGDDAIERIRRLRPGSIETSEQMQLIRDYSANRGQGSGVRGQPED